MTTTAHTTHDTRPGAVTRQRTRQAARRAEKGPSPRPASGPNRATRRRQEALLMTDGLPMTLRKCELHGNGFMATFPNGSRHHVCCSVGLATAIVDYKPDPLVTVKCVSTSPFIYAALCLGARVAA